MRPCLYTTRYEYVIQADMARVRRDSDTHTYAKLLLKRRSLTQSFSAEGGRQMAVRYADDNPQAIEVLLLIQPNERRQNRLETRSRKLLVSRFVLDRFS